MLDHELPGFDQHLSGICQKCFFGVLNILKIASKLKTMKLLQTVLNFFKGDSKHHEGVPGINIFLLRLLFFLMFTFLTFESWQHILQHTGQWKNSDAAAWCMWGSYSAISFIGIVRPLKMLPIVLFEIIYKVTWLLIVAYPLWVKNELAGSPAEEMTNVFIWVVFPIAAMPWRYLFKSYILK